MPRGKCHDYRLGADLGRLLGNQVPSLARAHLLPVAINARATLHARLLDHRLRGSLPLGHLGVYGERTGDGYRNQDMDPMAPPGSHLHCGSHCSRGVLAGLERHQDRLVLGLSLGRRHGKLDLLLGEQPEPLAAAVEHVGDNAGKEPPAARREHRKVEDADDDQGQPGSDTADDREDRQRPALHLDVSGAPVRPLGIGTGIPQAHQGRVRDREREHRPECVHAPQELRLP